MGYSAIYFLQNNNSHVYWRAQKNNAGILLVCCPSHVACFVAFKKQTVKTSILIIANTCLAAFYFSFFLLCIMVYLKHG
jgi:hypothetical protein